MDKTIFEETPALPDNAFDAQYYRGDEYTYIEDVFTRYISLESCFTLIDRIEPFVLK